MPYTNRWKFTPTRVRSPPSIRRIRHRAWMAARRSRRIGGRAAVLGRLGARVARYGRVGLIAGTGYGIGKYVYRSLPHAKKKAPQQTNWQPDNNTTTNLTTSTLQEYGIALPEGDYQTHDRRSDQIYLKGINLCVYARNAHAFPVMLHIAIVQYKSEQGSSSIALRRENFFSISEAGDAKSMDFPTTAPLVYDARINCNPLNSQRFNVITHRKIRMDAPNNSKDTFRSKARYLSDRYYPIKRRIDFRDDLDIQNRRPYYLLMWYQCMDPIDYTNTDSFLHVQVRTRVHWSNIMG